MSISDISDNLLLMDALRSEREREEDIYRGRSYLGAGAELFANMTANFQGITDAGARIALAQKQIDEIKTMQDQPVEVDIDDAQDRAQLDQLGQNIASAAAMNPTQASRILGEYERTKEKTLDKSRIDREVARQTGEAKKTAALLPAKQEAERAKLTAEQEKPGVYDFLSGAVEPIFTLLAASRPKTEQRRQEDIATRANKRIGILQKRIDTGTANDPDALAKRIKELKAEGQEAAKKTNILREQRFRRAQAAIGLREPETFGTNLANLTGGTTETAPALPEPEPSFTGFDPLSLEYKPGTGNIFNFSETPDDGVVVSDDNPLEKGVGNPKRGSSRYRLPKARRTK